MVFSNGSRFAKYFMEFNKTIGGFQLLVSIGRKKCFERAYMCMHPNRER